MNKNKNLELIDRAREFNNRVAIVDDIDQYSYRQLLADSAKAASLLLKKDKDLKEKRIAFLVPSSYAYVVWQWGIWRAGGIAVPLCVSHPSKEWRYVLEDTGCNHLIIDTSFRNKIELLREIAQLRINESEDFHQQIEVTLPFVSAERRAMIIYTSGTTGKPKGVVTTHKNISAQIVSLIKAWHWSEDDYILNCLPLHHVHGVVNVLCCALWAGAKCRMIKRFEEEQIWNLFKEQQPTLFMAVPTIYHKLISFYQKEQSTHQKKMSDAARKFRLMVSGSAALPVSVLEKWKVISGQTLLERYGMTEIGMALANSYIEDRIPGHVGKPLPGVKTLIVKENNELANVNEPGELRIKGATVFLEYWNKPEATSKAFANGWFCTGDIVKKDKWGVYKIVGRSSVDIIKTGGYKVSALEIEEVLRNHPSIKECAVVGVDDEEWGQRVSLAAILEEKTLLELSQLKQWAKERLAPYKIPTRLKIVTELPRNAMGKVMKPNVVKLFQNNIHF